jgi:hypothetical protein
MLMHAFLVAALVLPSAVFAPPSLLHSCDFWCDTSAQEPKAEPGTMNAPRHMQADIGSSPPARRCSEGVTVLHFSALNSVAARLQSIQKTIQKADRQERETVQRAVLSSLALCRHCILNVVSYLTVRRCANRGTFKDWSVAVGQPRHVPNSLP